MKSMYGRFMNLSSLCDLAAFFIFTISDTLEKMRIGLRSVFVILFAKCKWKECLNESVEAEI